MSRYNAKAVKLDLNPEILEKLSISHPAFLDWIHSHVLEGSNFEDTQEFLAFLGYALFQLWQARIPSLTLDDVCEAVFSDEPNETFDLIKSLN